MAETQKAKIIIEAEGDKAVREAKKVQKELKETGAKGKKAGNEIDQGANKGKAGLEKLGNESKETKRDMTALAVSVVGLGQSITGLADGMVGLRDRMLDIHKVGLDVKRTMEDLRRKKEDLTRAINAGELSAIEYERALNDISLTMEDLTIKEQELKNKTSDMGNEYLKFALNTTNTVIFSVIAVTTAISADTKAKIANALTTKGLTTATILFSKALWKVAKHPAFIIAAAGIAIWESNLFGFRTELEKLAGTNLGIMDNIQTLIEGGFNPAAEATDELTLEMQRNEKEMREWANTLKNNTNPELAQLTVQANKASDSVLTLSRSTELLKKKRPLDVIHSIVDLSLLSAADELERAVQTKGLIDQSMMNALVAAEQAGIIARGTAGLYRTSSGHNASGVIRAINKANNHIGGFFNSSGQKTFGSVSVNANNHSVKSEAGRNILSAASSSGQFKRASSSATGSRNTKREKDIAIRKGYASADFQLALSLGQAFRGAQKRHHAFRQIAAGTNAGARIRSVFEQTGIAIPRLNLRSTGRKGMMAIIQQQNAAASAAFPIQLRNAYTEAQRELQAFNALIAFNPNLSSINLAGAGIDRHFLENKLASEQSRFTNLQNQLGLDRTRILSLESTQQGSVVINGMLDFRQRMGLISGGVV